MKPPTANFNDFKLTPCQWFLTNGTDKSIKYYESIEGLRYFYGKYVRTPKGAVPIFINDENQEFAVSDGPYKVYTSWYEYTTSDYYLIQFFGKEDIIDFRNHSGVYLIHVVDICKIYRLI